MTLHPNLKNHTAYQSIVIKVRVVRVYASVYGGCVLDRAHAIVYHQGEEEERRRRKKERRGGESSRGRLVRSGYAGKKRRNDM